MTGLRSVQYRVFLTAFLLAGMNCAKARFEDTFHPPAPAGRIELYSGSRKINLFAESPAEVILIYFGFTRCPMICPRTMANLAAAYHDLSPGEQSQLRFYFLTVDPERDPPETARSYAQRFNSDFIGLSGSPEEVRKIVGSYGIYASDRNGEIDHTSGILYLKRTADGYRIFKRIPSSFRPEDLAHDLRLDLD